MAIIPRHHLATSRGITPGNDRAICPQSCEGAVLGNPAADTAETDTMEVYPGKRTYTITHTHTDTHIYVYVYIYIYDAENACA